MTLWGKVLSGFDAADETINFGARTVAESKNAIYETSTLATIQSDGEVEKNPNILASLQCNKLCVAIDKSITIFEDETCQNILLSISFDALLTSYCMEKNKELLFITLENGILYCLQLINKCRIVFSINIFDISDDCSVVVKSFTEEGCSESVRLILIRRNGAVHCLFIPLNELKNFIHKDDNELSKEFTKNINCTMLFKGFEKDKVICTAAGILFEEISIIIMGENTLFLWPLEYSSDLSSLSYRYKKLQILEKCNAIICLSTNNVMNIMCPRTLVGIKAYEESVVDFMIINDGNEDFIQILLLLETEQNDILNLRVVSFPGFEQKFQITVPRSTSLVDNFNSSVESILFIEGVVNEAGNINIARIKSIQESIPELRLKRLLKRKHFDEAEVFAMKFGLSIQEIYHSKAELIMKQLGPWNKNDSSSIDFQELLNILNKIQDIQFLINCSTNALLSDYKQMKILFSYIRQRVVDNMQDNNEVIQAKQLDFLTAINNSIHKLETFEILYGVHIINEYTNEQILNEWIRFSRVNLLDECKAHLSMGEIETAGLIWSRHLSDMVKDLSRESVRDIFNAIPKEVNPLSLWPWLSHFIPSLLSVIPSVLNDIVVWGYKKTRSLEQFHSRSWPEIGIDFATKFMTLLKVDKSPSLYFYQEFINYNLTFKYFVQLIQALSELQQLSINHRVRIPIESYLGDPIDVTHLLLDKIPVENIPEFIDKFFKQYLLNYSLENDIVLSTYIQKVINDSRNWWSWEEAPWEKKVITIISFIYNIQNRLQVVLEILKKAPIPWRPTIKALAEANMKLDHPLCEKIQIECKFVSVKLILKKYRCDENVGINERLISCIIKQNRSEILTDLRELTRTNQPLKKKAFSSYVNHHLSRGNIEAALNVLNELEGDIVLYCCERIVNYIVASLTLKSFPKSVECYIESLSWIKLKLQTKIQSYYYISFVEKINSIRSLYRLRKDFNIHVSFTEFHTNKDAILRTFIANLYQEVCMQSLSISTAYMKAMRVADILKLEKLYATFLLLDATKNLDILKKFTAFRSNQENNFDVTANESQCVKKICMWILQDSQINVDSAKIAKDLCMSALNTCPDAELESVLTLYVWADLLSKCLSVSYQNTVETKVEEVYKSNWKVYTIYKDLAISLDQSLLTILKDILSIFVCLYPRVPIQREINMLNQKRDLLKTLLDNIKKIHVAHNEYKILQIFKTFYFLCAFSRSVELTNLIEMQSVLSYNLITMLNKLISASKFDLHLGLSCLFMLPEPEAVKSILTMSKSFLTDYRHATISLLSYEYFRLIKNESFMQSFKWQKTLHYWAQKLTNYSIGYKEILTSNTEDKRQILMRLMNINADNIIPLLQDFSSSFGFNMDDCLMLYLQTVLKKWNPTLNISDFNGKIELKINSDEIDDLRAKCNAIAAKIINKSVLKQYVCNIWSQINFYHYEIYIILMDLVGDGNMDKRNYFCFLQNYTRSGNPTEVEQEEWLRLSPEYKSLPPIAKYRLPYLPELPIVKLITPELNLKTYEKWLSISSLIKLEPHIICPLAIKGEVTQKWENLNSERKDMEWSLYSKNSVLLRDVLKCVQRMTGPTALYYGTAALYCVVNYTPPGADQVAAIQQCYSCAEMAVKNSTIFEEGLLEKIRFKYLRFTSEHILRTHALGKDVYISLISNPTKLVHLLYMDDSIPLRFKSAVNIRPDINSAVDAFGKLHSLNLVKLRLELLKEWLQPDTKQIKFNYSFTDTSISVNNTDLVSVYDDNLYRACYLLRHGDTELFTNFLINIGFGENNDNVYTFEVRYRALYVLQSITHPTNLQQLTRRDLNTIGQYMKVLKYLSKLETLGLGYSMSTFESCSKEELITMLLNTQHFSPHALSLIAEMCIDYNIFDYSIWSKSLAQMAKLSMINELTSILPQVCSKSVIANSRGSILAWQVVTTEPFSKMDISPSSDQIEACIETLCFLHTCPVVFYLQFHDVLSYCFRSQQAHLAAAFLPYLNDTDKNYVLKVVHENYAVEKVINDLRDLSSKGLLTVSYCIAILKDNMETKCT